MSTDDDSAEAAWAPTPSDAIDRNPLTGIDEECTECDDDFDIDYDEIHNSTEPDFLAGRFWFNSADYEDQDEAMEVMRKMMRELCEEVMREVASVPAPDASLSE